MGLGCGRPFLVAVVVSLVWVNFGSSLWVCWLSILAGFVVVVVVDLVLGFEGGSFKFSWFCGGS